MYIEQEVAEVGLAFAGFCSWQDWSEEDDKQTESELSKEGCGTVPT